MTAARVRSLADVRGFLPALPPSRASWRPRPLDVLIALGVLLTALPKLANVGGPHPHERVTMIAFSIALAVPLLWRSRAPMATFFVVSAVALAQWIVTGAVFADIALLLVFYKVAATSSPRRVAIAAGVLELGVLLAVFRYAPAHRDYPLGFVFLSGLVTAAGVLGVNQRVRAAYLAEVEARAARLEFERDQHGQLAVAAERSRIARELHDIIAHSISVMTALADGACLTVESDRARASAAMADVSAAGRAAMSDMRRVLDALRDPSDPADLTPAPRVADLDTLINSVRATGLDVSYTCVGATAELPPAMQVTVYRLVQESLTNTVKHADRASRVEVSIRTADGWVDVVVRDNGASRSLPPESAGHGLIGMRERVAVHAGQVHVGPSDDGWTMHARLPMSAS